MKAQGLAEELGGWSRELEGKGGNRAEKLEWTRLIYRKVQGLE